MPDKLKIVFMGTPNFAVESLKTLIESGHNIVGVVTAPDKPAGRGHKLEASPVKNFAEKVGIEVILQPLNLKSPEFIEKLGSLKADIQVVVAFRMLPEIVWSMPPKGTINLHASLLPDYRGAAPINWAIINGETETGVTTFFVEKEIDTGHIILSEKVGIGPETTAGELHDKLMIIGARLLLRTVGSISSGSYEAVAQKNIIVNKKLNPAPKIFKEICRIDWNIEGIKIHNFIRGLSPYPAAWTELSKNDEVISLKIFESKFTVSKHNLLPGKLITDHKSYLKVVVKDGYIELLSLQQPGKKRLVTAEFLRGFQNIDSYNLLA
jgi:methionyl-tRNA formyltransferase